MAAYRLLIEWCVIAGLTIAITTGAVLTQATARIDNAIYGFVIGLWPPAASDRVIIVAIDDPSIAALGHWPWPRDIHARALDCLTAARAAAVAYDVLFTEPARDPLEDAQLARAVKRGPVALPLLLRAPGSDGRSVDIVLPVMHLSAAGIGHVALPHEDSGQARAALLAVEDAGYAWPHLAELVYRIAEGHASPAFMRARQSGESLVLVPYAAPGSYRQVSFKDVLAGSVPDPFLRDRIVLIGVTAGGLGDRHQVPGMGVLSGVEVQANVLNALLSDRFVREVPLAMQLVLAAMPSLLLLVLFWRLRPALALLASGAALFTMAATPVVLALAGWWLPPGPALLGLLIVYPLWGWRRLLAVDRTIAGELALFATDRRPGAPPLPALDPAGRSAAELSQSIAALRDLKQLIADTIEGVPDPLIVTSLGGRVLLANASAQAILKELSLEDLADDRSDLCEGSGDVVTSDGRSFSRRLTPLRDAGGEQRGWILLLAEITDIRAAERDREETLEFLSHDMRAPQSAIVHLLESASAKSVPEELANRIAGHARRTLALADDFVQLAKLRFTAFEPEETDICNSLAEAMDAAWSHASRKQVRVVAPDLATPHWVTGEHHALMRALFNLIDNAIKFSPDRSEVRCSVTSLRQGRRECVEVSVEDNGPGVSAERLANLFERFGPVDSPVMARSAGLGLSYAHAVAVRHGGSLHHTPVYPSGARFVFRLPALPDPSASDDSIG